ncbi:MAG: hypothetical protein AAF711_18895, partial [Planctomycetota bacterium]
ILFQYDRVNPTTWAYLSSLLTLALFFKFSRFWAVRNLDLLLVILLAPGLLCVKYGLDAAGAEGAASIEVLGYVWLFAINLLLLLRMVLDSTMVRRPLLEPNLTADALAFLVIALLVFLTANVVTGTVAQADVFAAQRAEHLSHLESSQLEQSTLNTHGPGFTLVFFLPHISTQTLLGDDAPRSDLDSPGYSGARIVTARVVAIISQLLIVSGLVLVSLWHFDSVRMGIAAAALYLLLPYTAMWTGNVTHALPGALLVWAVLFYRQPLIAGALLGLLVGTIYYPVFLLPLWVSFYWRRGVWRFASGVAASISLLIVTLVFTSTDAAMFFARLQQMFGFQLPMIEGLSGAWAYWSGYYRYPLIAVFAFLSISFVPWPAQKNLGSLLSCSAALMVGTQFWHAHSGGMSLAWYLPVLLLTVFRPNLEDRVALQVVSPSRWDRSARKAA